MRFGYVIIILIISFFSIVKMSYSYSCNGYYCGEYYSECSYYSCPYSYGYNNDSYINQNNYTQNRHIQNYQNTSSTSYSQQNIGIYQNSYTSQSVYFPENNMIPSTSTQGSVEKLLNYSPGIVTFDLGLESLSPMGFRTQKNQNLYNEFFKKDLQMRDIIMELYTSNTITQYQVNGIVRNYKTFIYHTKQYFYYLSLQEKNLNLKNDFEVNQALLNHYKQSHNAFQKVKTTLLNRNF